MEVRLDLSNMVLQVSWLGAVGVGVRDGIRAIPHGLNTLGMGVGLCYMLLLCCADLDLCMLFQGKGFDSSQLNGVVLGS